MLDSRAGNGSFSDGIDGGIASLLVGEAAQALGLKGFAGVVFTSVGTTITTQLLKNLTGWVHSGRR